MADETTKVIILSVELDTNQFSKALNQTEKDLEGLLTQQAVLIAQNKQGTQEYALLSAQIQKTRKDYKDNAQALNTVQQLQKKNTGSIFEMRRELSAATLQYNNLSKAERDNATVGGRLQTQIKALSDELKKNEKAVGDNRRNVGNYEQSIQSALSQTNLFGGGLSQISGILSTGGAYGIAISAAIGLTKLFGDAILSVDSNADRMQQQLAGAGAALKTFTGGIARSGGGGTTEFFGDLIQAFALLPASLAGLEDEAVDAINITEKLTAATQSLNDAERDASTIISANNVIIDQYVAKSKNRSLSDEERIDILEKAGKLEEENLKRQQTLAEARLRIIKLENELNKRQQAGELNDEQKQREADAINLINNLRQESLSLQERIEARRANIAEEANKNADEAAKQQTEDLIKELRDREKAIQDANKKAEELEKKRLANIKSLQDESARDRANFLKSQNEERNNAVKLANTQELAALKERFAAGTISQEEYRDELVDITIKGLERELEALNIASASDIELQDEVAQKEVEIAIETADAKIKENERVTEQKKKELDKQLEDEKKFRQQALDSIQSSISLIGEIESIETDNQLKDIDRKTKAELAAIDKKIKARQAEGKSFEDLEKRREQIEKDGEARANALLKEQFERNKKFQYAEALILTTKAVLQALAAVPPPANFILAALAGAEGLLQLKKIQATKFAKGGMPGEKGFVIGGKPHSQGGTKFIGSDGSRFEAEKDEAMIILNKRATDKMKYYSSLNYNNGGVDFFKGNKSSTYLQDGGFAARAVTQPVLDEANAQQGFNNLPPIFVLVEDINSAQGLQAKVKSRSVF